MRRLHVPVWLSHPRRYAKAARRAARMMAARSFADAADRQRIVSRCLSDEFPEIAKRRAS